ncbi:RNA-splicing ligase RtcB [Candidatus Woesearchaeota archaeon CG10_big_fil_rev_8_21_14_0_10_37_12]|nr:MAG: RNA-splicing ligase RtcB [Candidatus Woesearchaeota archaeon CG10_big_fil_rev_8_21_14_0_10_37_12]
MINRNIELPKFERQGELIWDIPKNYKKGMNVPARIYATEKLLKDMDLAVFDQITNVACLPGIQSRAMCMPDGHSGYGFPIGGVAAFDLQEGVISPGGIGFDVNCGMRLVVTNLTYKDVKPNIKELVDLLFKKVPSGVGCKGFVDLTKDKFREVMQNGAKWCVDNCYGWKDDLAHIEDEGCIKHANPDKVSEKAINRGINQLGTLGSGNHYLEIQYAGQIFDKEAAAKLGIHNKDQICVMVHCGSRGFGHQVGTDYLKKFTEIMPSYGITVPDPELACAPFQSKEGQDYYHAMACAANMAFANRQVILHRIRECFSSVFGTTAEELNMNLVYDVAHNIAKIEKHNIEGKNKEVVVHRKGSTRCFGPSRTELAPIFRKIGQPVIVGGSMETGSYLLLGTDKAAETFGSTMHGSGRTMSRTQARKQTKGEKLQKDMEKRGIYVRTASYSGLAEEAGFAYKNINEVIETMDIAGISKKLVALKPIGNIKG